MMTMTSIRANPSSVWSVFGSDGFVLADSLGGPPSSLTVTALKHKRELIMKRVQVEYSHPEARRGLPPVLQTFFISEQGGVTTCTTYRIFAAFI